MRWVRMAVSSGGCSSMQRAFSKRRLPRSDGGEIVRAAHSSVNDVLYSPNGGPSHGRRPAALAARSASASTPSSPRARAVTTVAHKMYAGCSGSGNERAEPSPFGVRRKDSSATMIAPSSRTEAPRSSARAAGFLISCRSNAS